MANLAIIPARGGSKRIPLKNIKEFLGRPIISYVIEEALESNIFDEVMVSTESPEIASLAQSMGARIPFLRSEQNANDTATTYSVIKEVIEGYAANERYFDYTCCLYPTAVFVRRELLRQTWSQLQQEDVKCVFPIVKFSYPIQRALKVENEQVRMVQPEHLKTRSQDLEPRYHDAGMYYFYHTETYLKTRSVFEMNAQPIILSEMSVQDIDNPTDWELAELKYKKLNVIKES